MDYIHESKCLSNEGAKRLSEINILTSEYNPYKRGTRVIKCLLYTPRVFMILRKGNSINGQRENNKTNGDRDGNKNKTNNNTTIHNNAHLKRNERNERNDIIHSHII